NITDPAFILELDGMLVPLSGVVPQPITYQAFTVTVGNPNHPPSAIATVTTPTVITGSGVGLSVSNLADPDNGSVTVSVDWDANGTTDYTSGAIPVPGGPVAYNSQTHGGMTFTFVPPGPDYRTLKVFVSDGAATVEITPGLGPNNEHFQVIANQAGWVRTWGAAVNDTRCWGVAVDGAGNTYAVGFFSSGANMGGGPRTTNGNLDIFVAKFDPAGTYLWDRTFGSTGQDEARAVACDNAGNVVITGIYTGTINFGGGGRPAVTGFDAFAVKLDPSGVYGWDKTWATVGDDLAWGAGMNAAGTEVAITGKHAGGLDFGGGFRSGNRRFVVRHNMATGAYVWDAPWTVTQGINVYGDCEYDASGNLYVMGHYESGNDFGSGPQGTFGSDDVFLCKFTAPGTFAWVQVFGGPSTEVGQALAIDSAGNPIVAHKSFGTMTYLSGMATGANQGVVKFNPAGTRLWDYFFLSGGSNWGLAVDGADNIAFTGGFTGSVNFGGGLRSAGGGFGSMLVKLSSGGVYIWDAIFAAGSGVNYSFGLDSAPDGSYRVAGNFTGTKDFDPSPATFNVTAAGSGSSAHLCRINGNGLW
ncbi:MAG TPA: hypothetical protein VEI97_05490, partial [bacterium]|nr:hypothetical protein [bacterium]